MDWHELPLDTRHLGVPSDVPKMISMPVLHSAQTVHPSSVEINTTLNGPKWASTGPTSPRSTIGCAKNDFFVVVHSAQTMHLSCAEINPISKRTEMSFHLTHVTKEYHRVCPRWFPGPWYVRHKPSTYLATRLTKSPNGSKWDSLDPRHQGVPSGVPKAISMHVVH
jgi:hypothetical protein